MVKGAFFFLGISGWVGLGRVFFGCGLGGWFIFGICIFISNPRVDIDYRKYSFFLKSSADFLPLAQADPLFLEYIVSFIVSNDYSFLNVSYEVLSLASNCVNPETTLIYSNMDFVRSKSNDQPSVKTHSLTVLFHRHLRAGSNFQHYHSSPSFF